MVCAPKREGSNSNTSNISHTRPRRKRRRRRRRVKKSLEEVQTPTDELKFQVRPKRGRRRRKRKRKVHIKENVMSLGSSGASTAPSSNSFGSQPSLSQSCNDFSQGSQMEYENLPWANLKEPMDLSLVDLEVNGDEVDFDLQAQENHQRWLANLKKARENDVYSPNTSQ